MTRRRRVFFTLAVAASTLALASTLAGLTAAAPASADADRVGRPAQRMPVASGAGLQRWASKLDAGLVRARGPQSVFVRLRGRGAAATYAAAPGAGAQQAALTRRGQIRTQSRAALDAARTVDADASRLFTTTNGVPGIGMSLDARGIAALSARADVVGISRLVPQTMDNAGAVALVRAVDTWQDTGSTGRGVRVGIVDSGLDYTHADFGGAGTTTAYQAALADDTSAGWRDALPALARAKVAGGYDFAGDSYDASTDDATYQPVPHADPNPLDCDGHGTHVAGTAAGYGVTAAGSTYTGAYASLDADALLRMKVGPGMAPRARLYPLRVFGCSGTTNLVAPALDWALDPNGDGDFSDHLDIVNLSLGGPFGVADEAVTAMVDALSAQGVLVVASIGNSGDLTDAGGSPGVAVSSLAVAASGDSLTTLDALAVDAPAEVAGQQGVQFSTTYPWSTSAPVSARVATLSTENADACDPLSAADTAAVSGRIAWASWDDDATARRCGSSDRAANVLAAGAVGLVLTSGLDTFEVGIAGVAGLPVVQLTASGTEALAASAADGTLRVTLDGSLAHTDQLIRPQDDDELADFSSRGSHAGAGAVKPDVTAPGVTIASAGYGTGTGLDVRSGTSMAAPVTTGVAALVKARHPRWTPQALKAAIMNTAGHDVFTGEDHTGARYAPGRVGAGRIDALDAVSTTLLAWTRGAHLPVSATFAVAPAPVTSESVHQTRTIVVANRGRAEVTVDLRYDAVNSSPGIDYRLDPSSLTVPAGGRATARLVLTVRPRELLHTIDPTMDPTQNGLPRQFVSDSSGRVLIAPSTGGAGLRVPVYAAAKPASTTTAVGEPGQIALWGAGVDQGSGPSAYESLVSVLQLGATSGVLPVCSATVDSDCTRTSADRAADLAAVGAGSSDGSLWFGVAMQAQGSTIGHSVIPFVDYDVDGDGDADYETIATTLDSTDVYVAATFDLATEKVVDVEPTNFEFGDVDSNVFDTDVVLLPVSRAKLGGLPATGSAPIDYVVGTYNALTGSVVDSTGPVAFDVGDPAVATSGPLYLDQGGTHIPVTHTGDAQALVIHLHGRPGHRAEVVSLP